MQDGLNEWLVMDEENYKFHMGQYDNPYRSTVAFAKFLSEKVDLTGKRIIDLGCGAGAVLNYFMEHYPRIKKGIGIDINSSLVEYGNKIMNSRNVNNCQLFTSDIYELAESPDGGGALDGCIALQVFNIMPEYESISKCMCRMSPDWVSFSMLGFEGLIDYTIKLYDYTKNKDGGCSEVYYNIYSLPRMKDFYKELGYKNFVYEKFEIDIDLPYVNKSGRGTYTVKTEDGKRLQISGAMLMPWYFVFASK